MVPAVVHSHPTLETSTCECRQLPWLLCAAEAQPDNDLRFLLQTLEDAQKFRLYNWNSAEDPDGNREVGPTRLLATLVQTDFGSVACGPLSSTRRHPCHWH